jgi:hypothetical protein
MTQPRTSVPRSSLAIALQYYKGPRPGIALTIAAVALIAAVVIGVLHIVMLGQSGLAISEGQSTMRTLHRYNAALEVWRQMAALPERELQFPEQIRLRDSIAGALQADLGSLRDNLVDSTDKRLVGQVMADMEIQVTGQQRFDLGTSGRSAMIVLAARQDSALFRAAAQYQRSQFFAAVVIGLTVLAAASLIFPIAWVYVRFKQGVPPGM